MLQSHINLSKDDKLFIGANYLKPDPNQGIYEFEYGRKFDRLDTSFKYTSNGMFAVAGVSTVAKGTFIGVEATMQPRAPMSYSYSFRCKPFKSFQFATTYVGYAQFFSLDALYTVNIIS